MPARSWPAVRALVVLLLFVPLASAVEGAHVHIAGAGTAAYFVPPVVVIEAGGSVTWSNDDLAVTPHMAYGRGIDTGILMAGDRSAPIRFDEPGTYFYRCPLHTTTMREAYVVVV